MILAQSSATTTGITFARATQNSNTFEITHPSVSTTYYEFNIDIELASKPTWADDFSIPWGITY